MALPNPALEMLLSGYSDPQALEDALYGRASMDIEDSAAKHLQATRENVAGRGLGIGDYLAALEANIEGEKAKALERARLDAFTASQQARLAALGNAAGAENQRNATQIAADNASKNRRAAKSGQYLQAGAGIGAGLLGAIGRTYDKEIQGGIRSMGGGLADLFGFGGGDKGGPAMGGGIGTAGSFTPSTHAIPDMPDFGDMFEDAGVTGFSDMGQISMPSFDVPTFNFDLASLGGDDLDFFNRLESLMA